MGESMDNSPMMPFRRLRSSGLTIFREIPPPLGVFGIKTQ